MYVYFYDHMLRQKKYAAVMRAIETRLTDYGIAGKILRLQNFTNAEQLVAQEQKNGATTVVIVGNDATFGQVLSRAAGSNVLFGFIPVGTQNSIAGVLGIPEGVKACDMLARRRIVSLDVGWFNGRYFISRLHIPPSDIHIRYDEKFTVSSRGGKIELVVCNLQPFTWKNDKGQPGFVIHPQDGKLEAFVRPVKKSGWFRTEYEDPSIFPFEEMVVESRTPFVVEADNKQSKETKITIKLSDKKIRMVVGKERKF